MDSRRSDRSVRRRRRASGRHARRATVEKRARTRQPLVGGRKDRGRSHLGHGGGAGTRGGGVSGGGLTIPAKWRGGTGGISAPRRRGEGVCAPQDLGNGTAGENPPSGIGSKNVGAARRARRRTRPVRTTTQGNATASAVLSAVPNAPALLEHGLLTLVLADLDHPLLALTSRLIGIDGFLEALLARLGARRGAKHGERGVSRGC